MMYYLLIRTVLGISAISKMCVDGISLSLRIERINKICATHVVSEAWSCKDRVVAENMSYFLSYGHTIDDFLECPSKYMYSLPQRRISILYDEYGDIIDEIIKKRKISDLDYE